MLTDAFQYQCHRKYVSQFILGTILTTFSFSVAPFVVLVGYFLQLVSNNMFGNHALPSFTDYRTLARNGVGGVAVLLVSSAPLFGTGFYLTGIIYSYLPSLFSGIDIAYLIIFVLVTVLALLFVIIHVTPLFLCYYVSSDSIYSFYKFRRLYTYLTIDGMWTPVKIGAAISFMVATLISILLYISLAFILLTPLILFYYITVMGYVYGYYVGKATGTNVDVSITDAMNTTEQ